MLSEKPEIHRVIRRGQKSDGLMSGASLGGLLNNTMLRPPGMPHDAVLIAKNIRCVVNRSGANGKARQWNLTDWQTGVDRALDVNRQNAARYVNGKCSASDANSVFFANVPEALACFLCDIVVGSVYNEWWWKTYLRRYPVGSDRFAAVARVINDNLIFLPHIVRYLAEWKMLATVFSGLSDSTCNDIIRNFLACFHLDVSRHNERLDELVRLLSGLRENASPVATEKDDGHLNKGLISRRDSELQSNQKNMSPSPLAAEEYQPLVPARAQSLTSLSWVNEPDVIALLGTLYSAVEYKSFGVLFDTLWRTFCDGLPMLSDLAFAQRNLVGLAYLAERNIHTLADQSFKNAFCLLCHPVMQARFHEIQRAVGEPSIFPAYVVERLSEHLALSSNANYLDRKAMRRVGGFTIGGKYRGGAPPAPLESRASQINRENTPPSKILESDCLAKKCSEHSDLSREWQWTTDYGGALYLLNLLRFLEVPNLLTDSDSVRNPLSLWAWLEILTRYLLVNEALSDNDDLWKALALLDDREPDSPPGGNFYYAGEFDASQICAPFPGLDESKKIVADESAVISSIFDGMLSPSLINLLHVVLPALKRCLVRAIGEEDESKIHGFLQCRGHIAVTRTHVDFYTSLDNISLAARRAGLDRDPGWCPEVGKVVLFHFE